MARALWSLLLITALCVGFMAVPKARAAETWPLYEDFGPAGTWFEPVEASACANSTVVDTTGPNGVSIESALGEVSTMEGEYELNVYVVADEEERAAGSHWEGLNWTQYAAGQIERGDNAMAANFGIDIRILGYGEWDSDDNTHTLLAQANELVVEESDHVGTYIGGTLVDAVIGITAQDPPDEEYGLASGAELLDARIPMVLVEWHGYWLDDNIVQHEVTHLFYPWDVYHGDCCVMANHEHFQYFITEDGHPFPVFENILCALTAYSWCSRCTAIIESFNCLYIFDFLWPYGIMLRYYNVYEPTGIFYLDGVRAYQGFYGYFAEASHTVYFEQYERLHFDYYFWKGTTQIYTQTFTFTPAGREGVAAVASEHVEMPDPGGHRGGGPNKPL